MGKVIELFRKRSAQDNFEACLAPHMSLLYKQAYHYTGSKPDAEDLLQDLLVELFSKQEQLYRIKHLKAWLIKCLYYRFVDRYRKQLRQPETEAFEGNDDDWMASETPEKDHMHRDVVAAIQTLAPSQRAVICLHDIGGYTITEISEMIDQPIGTLKSHLHRGRKILKQQLELD